VKNVYIQAPQREQEGPRARAAKGISGQNGGHRLTTGAQEIAAPSDALEFLEVSDGDVAARSPLSLFWRRIRRDRVAVASLAFVVGLFLVAIFAGQIVSILGLAGPYKQNLSLLGPFGEPTGPSSVHPMGVDSLGRDIMSRVIYGSRVSLEVGIVGAGISTVIGVVVGMYAGYYRGWTDTILSRTMDVILSIPLLLLGLGVAAACSVKGCVSGLIEPGLPVIIFLIAIGSWPFVARIVRGLVLSLREREFVEASRALGASDRRIMFREILPNLTAPIIVYASLLIPTAIGIEAALSFIGIGIRPPTASWGQMIAEGTPNFNTEWWIFTFPGLALLFTVLAFNLLGDGMQDALSPRSAR